MMDWMVVCPKGAAIGEKGAITADTDRASRFGEGEAKALAAMLNVRFPEANFVAAKA